MVPITRTPLSPLLLGLVAALVACSSGAVTVPEPEPDAATPAPTASVPNPPADSGPIGSVADAAELRGQRRVGFFELGEEAFVHALESARVVEVVVGKAVDAQ